MYDTYRYSPEPLEAMWGIGGLLLLLLLFVYLADAFIQGDLQRLGCVNYASAAESLTITSHPKDGAQGG